MRHDVFLEALSHLVAAYRPLLPALTARLPAGLAAAARMDPLSRAVGEEFGTPLVRWFGRGSRLRAVQVDDGVLVFDAPPGGSGKVLLVPGVEATGDAELPEGWRDLAVAVGAVEPQRLLMHDRHADGDPL